MYWKTFHPIKLTLGGRLTDVREEAYAKAIYPRNVRAVVKALMKSQRTLIPLIRDGLSALGPNARAVGAASAARPAES